MLIFQKLLKRTLIASATLAMLINPLKVSASDINDVLNSPEWNSYVEQAIKTDSTPGLAVAAVKGSDTGFKNWGYANIKEKCPMTEDTPVHIGSCSKAFTALSVLLLQEEGKLSIEDSVSDYIPWWHVTYNGQDADVKIWQLLNHCSGIPNAATMAKYPYGTYAAEEEVARIAENLELEYAPGEKYAYCNLGYCILAYLTETVSGVPFDEYVVKEIMQPIGMENSGYDLPVTQGYVYFWGRPKAYDDPHPKGTEGEELVVTTPYDMTLWMRAQMGQLELPKKLADAIASSHEVIESHQPKMPTNKKYFNGWEIHGNELYHNGWNPNFKAQVIINTYNQTAVFTDCNSISDAQRYAVKSCYYGLIDKDYSLLPDIERCDLYRIDILSTAFTILITVILMTVIILLITQKKRLSAKTSTTKKEKLLLIVRMILLIPLLCLSLVLPYFYGYMMDYAGFGYNDVWIWGGQSAIVMSVLLDVVIVLLIVSCITRYKRMRRC